MTRHEIVRRKLRFDVGLGDDATDPHIHSLENLRDVKIDIYHRHIEAVVIILLEELIAKQSARNHEPIVESIDAGDAESPIDVIGLELVRHALDIKNELVLLEPVRAQIIDERKIRIRAA